MLVKIFVGDSWRAASEYGDYEFDGLPAAGHKLAIDGGDGWDVAMVREIVHRIVDPGEAADVALLVSLPQAAAVSDEPLPLAALDGLGVGAKVASGASVPKTARPWG